MDVTLKDGKVRQMKMGSKLRDEEIREYNELIDEVSDTFGWSYNKLKDIPREIVEHRIPLIPGAAGEEDEPPASIISESKIREVVTGWVYKACGDYGFGLANDDSQEKEREAKGMCRLSEAECGALLGHEHRA